VAIEDTSRIGVTRGRHASFRNTPEGVFHGEVRVTCRYPVFKDAGRKNGRPWGARFVEADQ